MDRVLVTGATGQLGQSLQQLTKVYSEGQFFFPSKTELDITQAETIETYIKTHQITALINAAAYTQVDAAESQAEQAFLVNEQGVKNCIDLVEKYRLKALFFSTDYVFGTNTREVYIESDTISPVGVYARSKAAGEQWVLRSRVPVVLIRTAWVFSPFGKNFVKTMLHQATQKKELKVVNDQWGNPTYALDLASVCLQLLAQYPHQNEIFHVVNKGVTTWFEFAKAIMEQAQLSPVLHPVTTKDFPTAAVRPQKAILDSTKIASYLGVEMQHWQTALADCLKQRSNES